MEGVRGKGLYDIEREIEKDTRLVMTGLNIAISFYCFILGLASFQGRRSKSMRFLSSLRLED